MGYDSIMFRFLSGLEADSGCPPYSHCCNLVTDKSFIDGHLSAVRNFALYLGFTKRYLADCSDDLTEAGREYVWKHSDPAWTFEEISDTTSVVNS